MKLKTLFILIGCMLGVFAVLAVLYASSSLGKEIYRGPFERKFLSEPFITQKTLLDLKYNSYYIAGVSDRKIYLGNTTSPFHIITVPLHLTDSQHVKVKLKGIDSLISPLAFRTVVDSPDFFLFHGTMPLILKGKVNSWEASQFMGDNRQPYFVEAVPVETSSFALRSFSSLTKQYELGKRTIDSPYFNVNFNLLKKQVDGIFCVDGKLHFDKETKKIIYLYSYRNQFIVADSNLNLTYVGHTIDTISRARIKVTYVKSTNENMLTSLPIRTNIVSTVSKNHLFVQSNLLSKNEDAEKFMNEEVIDVYELTTGNYLHSFYIPRYKGKRLQDFRIIGDNLLMIFDHYLISCKMNISQAL